MYKTMFSHWDYVSDCYKGVIEVKSDAKIEKYLPKFPAEARNHAKHPQYILRCWAADYDNIFKSAIMSMVGVMGKIPAKIEFGNVDQAVRDLDVWGNEDDDRLVGLKARLNHAQTLFGRYGLWLDVLTDANGLYPQFIIKEYTCYQIIDGDTYISPLDGKRRLQWVKLDESRPVFNPKTKEWDRGNRFRILGVDNQERYYSAELDGDDADGLWQAFDLGEPEKLARPNVKVRYPQFNATMLNFIPFTVCNVDRLGIDKWQEPPFLDMAHSTINAYNADSLHKQAMANHASPTLVALNAKIPENATLGGVMTITGAVENLKADVRMLETNAGGLAEMGRSAESIRERAMRRTIVGIRCTDLDWGHA